MKNTDPFKPILTILPEQQRRLWPELKLVPDEFVLYGGTAIALQIGHRESIDFDFFSKKHFDPDELLETIPFLNDARIVQRQENTLTAIVDRDGLISVSFFGLPKIQSVRPYRTTEDNGIKVASLIDLAGMKVSVIQKRAEWKDYTDIAALLDAGITLEQALDAGQKIYGTQFNPQISLKALSYFDDIKELDNSIKTKLQNAVKHVDLRQIRASVKPNLSQSRGFKP
jgi:hypothetical protein